MRLRDLSGADEFAQAGRHSERRQMQFADDFLRAHCRMAFQQAKNRLGDFGRRIDGMKSAFRERHGEHAVLVACFRRFNAGFAQLGKNLPEPVTLRGDDHAAVRRGGEFKQREQELVARRCHRRPVILRMFGQYLLRDGTVQSARIRDGDTVGEHADTHGRALRVRGVVTVNERVRDRLAQRRRRVFGLTPADPPHQRFRGVLDHHRDGSDHMLGRNQ